VLLSVLGFKKSHGFKPSRIEIPNEHEKSNIFENSTTASELSKSTAWHLPLMKGVMKGQMLHVRKIDDHPNKWHSCYEVTCENTWKRHCPPIDSLESTISFCYPAIVITGLPKGGTSATYELLKKYSGSITMFEKENCPYTRRRSHWEYFHTLPKASDLKVGQLIIDGCLDTQKNMMLRRLLHDPETIYVVMTRNYADLIWSSYNFWCKREYDGLNTCDNTRWVKSTHNRSIDLFHDMVIKDKKNLLSNKQSPLHGDLARPCINAGGFIKEYLELMLWNDRGGQYITRGTDPDHTVILASEDLETKPILIWKKIALKFNMIFKTSDSSGNNDKENSNIVLVNNINNYIFSLGNFTKTRTNTQENKGTNTNIPMKDYKPGIFKISNYKSLRDDTRLILNECWKADCVYTSQVTQHQYEACEKESQFMNG